MTNSTMHPFEVANLGTAPFRFVGMTEKIYVACQGAPVQPGGACDYCGTGIRYCCEIKSADGKRFIVGSDCVHKIADERNTTHRDDLATRRLAAAVKRAELEMASKKRQQKAKSVVSDLETWLNDESICSALSALPHPRGIKSLTLLDWCCWILKNAGAKGQKEAHKAIQEAIKV